jgi:uncharacterized lipoprotein YajG
MKKYGTILLAVCTAMAVSLSAVSLPAAAKTKTKKVKALSETTAEQESKAEVPSLSEISKANKIYRNLKKGTYTSILMTQKTGSDTYETMISKNSNGEIQTVVSSAAIHQVQKGNLEYHYSKKGLVSIYAAEPVTSGSITCPYRVFSNETVTEVTETKNTYRISTSADISKMTETEQKDTVGTNEGIIEKELVVDKDTLLLKKCTYTIFFDASNQDFKHVSKTTFSYNTDPSSEIPENITAVINAEKTRTVTIVSAPGTKQEEEQAYTVPDTMPLYIRTSAEFYQDAACTEIFEGAKKGEDGVYPSYTIYIQ